MDPILALLIGLGGLVVAIIGLSVSFSVAKRGNKKSTTEEGEEKGVMQASLNYLKHIAEETAGNYIQTALHALSQLPQNDYSQTMAEIAGYVLDRKS